MILISTSRRPTQRIRSFCHDLERVLPDSFRVNRGKSNISGIVDTARSMEADGIMIIERWKGSIGRIRFINVSSEEKKPILVVLIIGGVKMQRDLGSRKVLSKKMAVIVEDTSSPSVKQFGLFLSHFLKIPYFSEIPLTSQSRFRAAIHLKYLNDIIRITFMSLPTLKEVGPRIDVKKIVWNT